ncbi:N-terminal phage integrase SAM-like domain-containing protein [Micromonosporaceae bacterium B7E4]
MWTLKRWLEFWLSENEGRLRPSTLVTYRGLVNDHLIPQLGHVRMRKLRTRDAQRAMDRISHRHVRGGPVGQARTTPTTTQRGDQRVPPSSLTRSSKHQVTTSTRPGAPNCSPRWTTSPSRVRYAPGSTRTGWRCPVTPWVAATR